MSDQSKVLVAVTDDDISVGQSDQLERLITFHQPFGIPVSYFIVPFPKGESQKSISQDEDLIRMANRAVDAGSEILPHSYEHFAFEWGYPEIAGALEFSTELSEMFADKRFELEAYNAKENMQKRMHALTREWEKFSGVIPKGFRPGWGSFSPTLYHCLKDEGYEWCSARFASRTPWLWCKGDLNEELYREEINEHVGLTPYLEEGIVEYPILGDYGFYAHRQRKDDLVGLFKRQFELCRQAGAPCVICHHPHGMVSHNVDPDSGFEIYHEIFSWLCKSGQAEFVTMSQLHSHWKEKAKAKIREPLR